MICGMRVVGRGTGWRVSGVKGGGSTVDAVEVSVGDLGGEN